MRLLHDNASARTLGLLRIWVFTQWIADLIKDPISPVAVVPMAYFEPIGIMRWLPDEFWVRMHTVDVLNGWRIVMIGLLMLSAIGVPFYRIVALITCVLLTFYQGFLASFAEPGHINLVPLYIAYIVAIFPAADALSLHRVRGERGSAVYRAGMVTATGVFLVTYMFVGIRRLLAGGAEIFTNGTILRTVAERTSTPDYLDASLGLSILQSPILSGAIVAGFVAVTVFEIFSLLCLSSPWFRRAWLFVILLFHVLSWPLLQTLFLHNMLLMGVLLVDLEGLARLSFVRSIPLVGELAGLLLGERPRTVAPAHDVRNGVS